jgi:hypothetical protein
MKKKCIPLNVAPSAKLQNYTHMPEELKNRSFSVLGTLQPARLLMKNKSVAR